LSGIAKIEFRLSHINPAQSWADELG